MHESFLLSFPDQDGVAHGPYLPLTDQEVASRHAIPGTNPDIDEQTLHQVMSHGTAVSEAYSGGYIGEGSADVLAFALNAQLETLIRQRVRVS